MPNPSNSPFRSVDSVLRPKSIALVGASERARWPSDIYGSLTEHGYKGKIYLINPRQSEVYGQKVYPSLRELPEPVDHAIVIVPGAAVNGVLEDAAARGIRSATVYAGGVGDGATEVSRQRGEALKELVARTGLRVSGPNCMGGLSYREKLFAYPNPRLTHFGPGPVGCLFQSGGTLQFFMSTAGARGVRFSYGLSTGNELDLDLADFINDLVEDEHTKQIVLFIEGIRRPEAFMLAAGRALEAGKPVIAIKTGATESSALAAASHTGAIAGDYEAYLAMCDRYGIVNCTQLDDLVETVLAFQSGRRPRGPKVGWVTTSGGTVDLLYDCVEQEGTPLAQFSPATNEAIGPFMQEGIVPKNPLDVGIPSTLKAAADLCAVVAQESDVDILAWANQLPGRKDRWPDLDELRKMVEATDKPVIGFARMAYQMGPEAIDLQDAVGFPFLQGLPATCRALNALWFHAQRADKFPPQPGPAPESGVDQANLEAILAGYGIHGPKSGMAVTAEEAAILASEIGFPVVLKISSADILHKTEAGGVVLDLRSADDVIAAAEQLLQSAKVAYPNAAIDGFLVQEMVSGIEAIAGARSDALYGPMLLVGSGGVLVELLKDAALKLLPVSDAEIGDMIDGLKLAKLLKGFRGKPPADIAALKSTIAGLARFYLDHRANIADIEINPLIVRPEGKGVCAVDVRVIWRGQSPA
ncbi:MAG: acetate--CoA ligase family protein [Beijerinckiaceae bacterium]